jgi:hypothetical protein
MMSSEGVTGKKAKIINAFETNGQAKVKVNKSQVKGFGPSQGINNQQVKDKNRYHIRKQEVKVKKSRQWKGATKPSQGKGTQKSSEANTKYLVII